MKTLTFIKKPFLTIVAVVFVVAAIIYIESKKPDIAQAQPQTNPNEQNTKYPRAPDFVGIEKWINSEPLKIEQLRGKVVLVDFWTYTCINCIRTLPYLKDWDKKYRDKGLVIVGVHTPEFEFEKKYENVLKAVNDYQLKYAVAQDNNYATWSVYQNRYWPHKFLIDIDGYIRYDHIGEGAYDETERMIQTLLKERMERLNKKNDIMFNVTKPKEAIDVEYRSIRTPEIYFGYQFSRGNFGNPEGLKANGIIDYKLPLSITPNNVYIEGKWKNNADNLELVSDDGSILLIFHAKAVNIVAGSENSSEAFVFLDNEFENEKNKGADVFIKENKSISNINEFKLYNIANAENYGSHALSINVAGKGFRIYTFTFG
ncbi:thioredoxin family protein [Candidatus Woesearchaeota archaeon]|nr:thioredoxin family protein [Candidatus Woesearchaeota archaeon]